METLARCYTSLGINEPAMEIYREVLGFKHLSIPADSIDIADTIHNMGVTLQGMCKFDEAIDAFKTALLSYGSTLRNADAVVKTANAVKNIGVSHSQQGRHIKAIEYFNRALLLEKSFGQCDMGTVNTINNLGVAYARLQSPHQAMSLFKDALAIVDGLDMCDWHVDVADLLYNIGVMSNFLGYRPSAKKHLKRSIRIFNVCVGDQHAKSLRAKRILRSLTRRSRHSCKRSSRHFRRRLG